MTREKKIKAIRVYSKDLIELAVAYKKCVDIIDTLDDTIVDTMYVTSVEGNRIHDEIVRNAFSSGVDG